MNTKFIFIAIIIALLGTVGFMSYKVISLQNGQNPRGTRFGSGQFQGQGQRQNPSPMNGAPQGRGPAETKANCLADGCLAVDNLNYPAGNLTEIAKTALTKALDDEYKAQATYEAIVKAQGNIRPFIMIMRAEDQHISSLKALFDKYGLEIPDNPYTGKVSAPTTVAAACTAGVNAETANVSLYKDELLPIVKDYEDITLVFTNLMNASQQKHLVAFQRCAE